MPHIGVKKNVITTQGSLPDSFSAAELQQQSADKNSKPNSKNVTPTPLKAPLPINKTPNKSNVQAMRLIDESQPPSAIDDDEEDALARTHSELQSLISNDSTAVFNLHRRQIDVSLQLSRRDLQLSKQYENGEIDLDAFCEQGLALMEEKLTAIHQAKQAMKQLQDTLIQENDLTIKLNQRKQQNKKSNR